MPRVNEERDGDYAEYAGTGTGSHWDRACESTEGDHESGEERLDCNTSAGTGSGTNENDREETWSAASALAAFPPEEGWQHIDRGPCECCGTACFIDLDSIPETLWISLNGTVIELTRYTLTPEYRAQGASGQFDVNVHIQADCVVSIFIVDIENCYDKNIQTLILCQAPSFTYAKVSYDGAGAGCDPPGGPSPMSVELCASNPCAGTGTCVADEALWWCVKSSTPGNRRQCVQGVTSAYDGPFSSQAACESSCVEPDVWCVEWQDEDEESNPIGRPYVTCENLGTGDEIGQIIVEADRSGIVVDGPWTAENCTNGCPPCSGDYAS